MIYVEKLKKGICVKDLTPIGCSPDVKYDNSDGILIKFANGINVRLDEDTL